ncbi:MAG: heme NO-binding domain-containing protein [Tabrizicola sp.]
MDALLLRSLQNYVLDTFGSARWQEICFLAGHPSQTFEPMLHYETGLADKVADVVARVLDRPVAAIWEDVGIYLVVNPDREGVRRLLRFGGVSFDDFLHSLEELPGRAWLALPDIRPPEISLHEVGPDRFELRCRSHLRGVQRVLMGVVSAMADDYGALCLIDAEDEGPITISMLDSRHAAAKAFELARPGA